MKETLNYKLRKPDQTDFYNVDDFNYNADIIDAQLKTNADAIAQHVNAAAPHSGHALLQHTHAGGDITSAVASAINADTVDGKHASDFVSLGATNQDINFLKALIQRIDTRSTVLAYGTNGRLTQVVEKDGATTVKTVTLSYDDNGNLTQVIEVVGGKTVTTTLSYDGNGNLTSVSRTVV